MAGCVWGTWDWTRDPWLTGLAGVILGVAVAPFFVPTGYRLSSEGIEISRPWRSWRRPWTSFRAVRPGPDLVVLSPFAKRSWLDSIRGEILLLEGNGGEVLEYVEAKVGKETRSDAG